MMECKVPTNTEVSPVSETSEDFIISEKPKTANKQSNARLAVVQAVYLCEQNKENPDSVILDFLSGRIGREVIDEDPFTGAEEFVKIGDFDTGLFKELVNYILTNKADIDAIIASHLSAKWPEERLELVLRSILRAGIAELYRKTGTDTAIIINEYIELSRSFYEEGAEAGLVNAVLDSVAKKVRDTK